jgi:two-component system sensor histidine kinase KdpD
MSVDDRLRATRRGRLKVFLGAAAGVGKTYAMLGEARDLKAAGVDVVVGYLKPHGRRATEQRAAGLEVAPRRVARVGGRTFTEMDTDWLLQRAPQLVLVDELAHTNLPGGRHEKRWQDVEELLAAGIDAFTTVNIQHLESLNDKVFEISGVRVRETFPDRLLHQADEVVLVDLPPEALRERIAQGRVYAPEKVRAALTNFFRTDNLTALRALALREVAEQEEGSLTEAEPAEEDVPAIGERVMVCIDGRPNSAGWSGGRPAWRAAPAAGSTCSTSSRRTSGRRPRRTSASTTPSASAGGSGPPCCAAAATWPSRSSRPPGSSA